MSAQSRTLAAQLFVVVDDTISPRDLECQTRSMVNATFSRDAGAAHPGRAVTTMALAPAIGMPTAAVAGMTAPPVAGMTVPAAAGMTVPAAAGMTVPDYRTRAPGCRAAEWDCRVGRGSP